LQFSQDLVVVDIFFPTVGKVLLAIGRGKKKEEEEEGEGGGGFLVYFFQQLVAASLFYFLYVCTWASLCLLYLLPLFSLPPSLSHSLYRANPPSFVVLSAGGTSATLGRSGHHLPPSHHHHPNVLLHSTTCSLSLSLCV